MPSRTPRPPAEAHPRYDALLAEWCDLLRRCTAAAGDPAPHGPRTASDANATAGHDAPAAPAVPDPAPYGREMLARWAQPHRRYHTLDHLVAVLARVTELTVYARDPDTVALAAWFHDVVYRPDRSENEERSAALAERALREAGVDAARTAEVARLVRLTAGHDPAAGDRDGEVLCDADLAVLAGDPAAYAAYAAAVREEFAFLPDEAFRAGRSDVLRRLLALPRLFRTPYGRQEWEERARRNVATELELLSA